MRLLIISLAAFVSYHPCRANIGDTIEQAKQKLGEPDHRYPVSGSNQFILRWIKDGLGTDIYFGDDGVAYEEQYIKASSASHLSVDDARHILASESDLTNWTEYHLAERVAWRSKTDGRAAVYGADSHVLIIVKRGEWVEAIMGGNWPRSGDHP